MLHTSDFTSYTDENILIEILYSNPDSLNMSADENKSDSVWLFTYGTLFWDCEFAYKERQVGFIHGFKRR